MVLSIFDQFRFFGPKAAQAQTHSRSQPHSQLQPSSPSSPSRSRRVHFLESSSSTSCGSKTSRTSSSVPPPSAPPRSSSLFGCGHYVRLEAFSNELGPGLDPFAPAPPPSSSHRLSAPLLSHSSSSPNLLAGSGKLVGGGGGGGGGDGVGGDGRYVRQRANSAGHLLSLPPIPILIPITIPIPASSPPPSPSVPPVENRYGSLISRIRRPSVNPHPYFNQLERPPGPGGGGGGGGGIFGLRKRTRSSPELNKFVSTPSTTTTTTTTTTTPPAVFVSPDDGCGITPDSPDSVPAIPTDGMQYPTLRIRMNDTDAIVSFGDEGGDGTGSNSGHHPPAVPSKTNISGPIQPQSQTPIVGPTGTIRASSLAGQSIRQRSLPFLSASTSASGAPSSSSPNLRGETGGGDEVSVRGGMTEKGKGRQRDASGSSNGSTAVSHGFGPAAGQILAPNRSITPLSVVSSMDPRSYTSHSAYSHHDAFSYVPTHLQAPNFIGPYGGQTTNFPSMPAIPPLAASSLAEVGASTWNYADGDGDPAAIVQPMTWSQMTNSELVVNLSGRERTRQEVLWEMVGSEERYVQELISMKINYLDPLLHPFLPETPSPPLSSDHSHSSHAMYSSPSNQTQESEEIEGTEGNSSIGDDRLPIASKFARRSSTGAGALGTGASSTSSLVGGTRSEGEGSMGSGSLPKKHVGGGLALPEIESEESVGHDSGIGGRMGEFGVGRTKGQGGSAGSKSGSANSMNNGRMGLGVRLKAGNASNTSLSGVAGQMKASLGLGPRSVSMTRPDSSQSAGVKSSPSSHGTGGTGTTQFAFRHHLKNLSPPPMNKLHRSRSAVPTSAIAQPPPVLPEELKIALSVIGDELLKGHEELSGRLRERYKEQYPLVRGLSDVWAQQTWIVEHYATYILHLEKALEAVDEALSTVNPALSNKNNKKMDKDVLRERKRVAKLIMKLEEQAAERGESGLAICLSKPFQRLLKYPLLFQALLYHTDPSTHEYETTQAMALEIDAIVRSIENEKISEDERLKCRDAFARIDGLRDKALMGPRSDRLLMEETQVWTPPGNRRTFSDAGRSSVTPDGQLKEKRSIHRLSDLMSSDNKQPALGSKRDIWLVVFSDVVIRCQRTGVTDLPMGSLGFGTGRDKSKWKKGIRPRQRNLYKFVKVEKWEMYRAARGGLVSMEDIAKRRTGDTVDEEAPEETDDNDELDDTVSRMSFNYSGDEPKPLYPSPIVNSRTLSPPQKGDVVSAGTHSVLAKNTPAFAKFGNRVRPASSEGDHARSPTPRYNAPTASSLARAVRPMSPYSNGDHKRPSTSTALNGGHRSSTPPPRMSVDPQSTPKASRFARSTSDADGSQDEDAGVSLYQAFWQSDPGAGHNPVPFPTSR